MQSALYSIYALVVFVSEISVVRFLIRQQPVRKYRTPALFMKYSLYIFLPLFDQSCFFSSVFKKFTADPDSFPGSCTSLFCYVWSLLSYLLRAKRAATLFSTILGQHAGQLTVRINPLPADIIGSQTKILWVG